jgi:hypothetical protein
MVRYEPPYVVRMIDEGERMDLPDSGVVYSSGNPGDAQAFAQGLYDTGAAVVEVRDAAGRLVRRFSALLES